MRRLPLFLAMALVVAALVPAGFAAIDPLEWDTAVASAQQVDPLIEAPPNSSTVVSAVGGGRVVGASFPAFAFGAVDGPAGVQGRMTLAFGFGQTLHADVLCLSAVSLDGIAGATVVGALEPNEVNSSPYLIFRVTDGGPRGLDAWQSEFSDVANCAPSGSVVPIEGGIAINTR